MPECRCGSVSRCAARLREDQFDIRFGSNLGISDASILRCAGAGCLSLG